MLKDLDRVCRTAGIPYMLFAGTALGAVRHRGFIPWDDDVDVVLLRRDYEAFWGAADSMLDRSKYYLQHEFGPHWPMQFSKLRLNGTACMEKYHPKDPQMHQGVYIDIFPCDNLADSPLVSRLQLLASKAVIARCLYDRGYETDSLLKKGFMQICRLLPREKLWRFVTRQGREDSVMVHTFFGCGRKYKKCVFPRTWFLETEDMPFEDGMFPVSKYWDPMLARLYGNYRELPPPEARKCKEHAAILDLHRPYTEYLDRQREMKIDTYTRSIR